LREQPRPGFVADPPASFNFNESDEFPGVLLERELNSFAQC